MLSVFTSLFALLAGIAVLGLANSLMFTLLGIRMSAGGVSGQMIGIVGSAYFAGMLTGSLLCGRVIRRVGHIRAFTVFAAISGIATLLHVLIPWVPVWVVLRAAMGFCSAGLFVVAESWLQFKATNETRGRTYALYALCGSAGAGVGPLLVNLGDPAGPELFLIAAILLSVCLLPVALTRVGNPEIGEPHRFGLRELYAISPVAVTGAIVAGLVTGSIAALGAVFGERIGMTALLISLLMMSLRLGGSMMQWPIGALSDRFDRRRVMIVLSLASALLAAVMFFAAGAAPALILLVAVAYGGLTQPFYGLVVSHANDYVEKDDFLAAAGGLIFAYGMGAIAGPTLTAIFMDWIGPAGLFVFTGVVLLAFCAFVFHRMSRRAPVPTGEQADFVPTPPNLPGASSLLDPRADGGEKAGKTEE